MHLYNDNDIERTTHLSELIQDKQIPLGYVEHCSIENIDHVLVNSCTQCHFFAGIGGWPLALQLANWPEDLPVWTASLPCQPFSQAGKQLGEKDERHLWPVFRDLVEQCRPPIVFGEQVASKAGRAWLATVRAEMEALGYAVGAADLCAAGIGAPHIRQRLFWVAYRDGERLKEWEERNGSPEQPGQPASSGNDTVRCSGDGGLGNASSARGGWNSRTIPGSEGGFFVREQSDKSEPSSTGGRLSDTVHVPCSDGKWRPLPIIERSAQPGAESLAHVLSPLVVRGSNQGAPEAEINPDYSAAARVMRLRGYGNAIVPELAAVFIESVMEIL